MESREKIGYILFGSATFALITCWIYMCYYKHHFNTINNKRLTENLNNIPSSDQTNNLENV